MVLFAVLVEWKESWGGSEENHSTLNSTTNSDLGHAFDLFEALVQSENEEFAEAVP
jgi:hypothetical protein